MLHLMYSVKLHKIDKTILLDSIAIKQNPAHYPSLTKKVGGFSGNFYLT